MARRRWRTALDADIGTITVEDGTLNVTDVASGKTYRFDGVTADIGWPKLSSPIGAVSDRQNQRPRSQARFLLAQPAADVRRQERAAEGGADLDAGQRRKFDGVANIAHLFSLSGQHVCGHPGSAGTC
jgi:AsmA protein